MREIKKGEIYNIQFSPSTGHEYQKLRPAVIISSDSLVKRSNLVTCIPFTGKLNNCVETDDILVKKDTANNLYQDSLLKLQHLSTFDKRRVKNYIGKIDEAVLNSIKTKMRNNFEL